MTNEEINKRIHEKFFPDDSGCDHHFVKEVAEVVIFDSRLICEKCHKTTLDYCGNMTDAWKIVRVLKPKHYLNLHENQYGWFAVFDNKNGGIYREASKADTPAMAICLAALEISLP